ncbi:hypothetical protein [Parabacteroides sp. FAFU027]|uniref:hypothetical protein n=1 Tax=Parabacteroides sp. FAFU027 TaxID=2922715 RepID=UPI001FB03B76|nr:hypothetical protein [Parabacteroides sp. FAFU027]
MAKAENLFEIEGKIRNLSFYKMAGCDKTIVRTKGGPSKNKIKKHPNFEKVRKNNSEWSGCTKMSRLIFKGLHDVFAQADYPVIGTLNALCKKIQLMDTEHEQGFRGVYLSKYGEVLEGFSPNRRRIFGQILSVMPEYKVDREALSATLSLPPIDPAYHLVNEINMPYYRVMVNLAFIPDVYREAEGKDYTSTKEGWIGACRTFESEWLSTSAISERIECTLNTDFLEKDEVLSGYSLVLGMGIVFGKANAAGQIEKMKQTGTGRILKIF